MQRLFVNAIVVAVLVANGCDQRHDLTFQVVHVVVPDGFVGEIQIVRDPVNGIEIKREVTEEFRDGLFTYDIPLSGILRVKEHYGLATPNHLTYGRYRSGTSIPPSSYAWPQNGSAPRLDSDAIVLHEINSKSGYPQVFFLAVESMEAHLKRSGKVLPEVHASPN